MGDLREIVKATLVIFIWFLPVYLVKLTGNVRFLWLFIMSFIVMMFIFSHYEELGK